MIENAFVLDVDRLSALIGEPNCRVVDCRFDLMDPGKGFDDYRQAHIPGAVYANLDTDLAAPVTESSGRHPLPEPARFQEWLETAGIDSQTLVVAYDGGNGATASRLWWMLRWVGHDKAAVLDGGLGAWLRADKDTESAIPNYARTQFVVRPNAALVLTTAEIVAGLADNRPVLLVDARDERRFRGEIEPIDTVAGHIPGSVNLPFTANTGADGRFLSPDEIRANWSAVVDADRGRPAVMCGSGVTACHLALSALLCGLPEPRLYVGSWSEWIRDPERPIEPVPNRQD